MVRLSLVTILFTLALTGCTASQLTPNTPVFAKTAVNGRRAEGAFHKRAPTWVTPGDRVIFFMASGEELRGEVEDVTEARATVSVYRIGKPTPWGMDWTRQYGARTTVDRRLVRGKKTTSTRAVRTAAVAGGVAGGVFVVGVVVFVISSVGDAFLL